MLAQRDTKVVPSRDGRYLIASVNLPEAKTTVFDMQTRRHVMTVENKICVPGLHGELVSEGRGKVWRSGWLAERLSEYEVEMPGSEIQAYKHSSSGRMAVVNGIEQGQVIDLEGSTETRLLA